MGLALCTVMEMQKMIFFSCSLKSVLRMIYLSHTLLYLKEPLSVQSGSDL